jgi:hypothetical protein
LAKRPIALLSRVSVSIFFAKTAKKRKAFHFHPPFIFLPLFCHYFLAEKKEERPLKNYCGFKGKKLREDYIFLLLQQRQT